MRTLLEGVIPQNGTFKDLEIEYDSSRQSRRVLVLNAHRIVRDADGVPMVLLGIEDDTDRRSGQQEQLRSNIDLKTRVEAQEQQGRELARSVETTRQQALAQSDAKIAALEQKALDLADFVGGLRDQTRVQSEAKIAMLVEKARELAVFVEAVRKETLSRAETEIAALGHQAQELAASEEAVRKVTLLHSDSRIAALGQSELATSRLNEELELRAREHTRQLEAANQELEAFCYSVSHDLRAPLRALDGFSQELLLRYADRLDEQGRHYLRRVRVGTQRMGQLIDDLLKLSRVTRSEMRSERVDLTALAEAVVAELREREPARNVTFTAHPGLNAVGDTSLLRIVLENLLGNAWKFTAKRPEAVISFTGSEDAGRPVFVVRDDGAGFDMTYAGKLFGAFQRLHSDREFTGTGIGLATVQRVLRRHGGEIRADGAVGRGAAFSFTLPGPADHS
ncbi:sensor histidine kinase [Limnoglobus roseus]|uniref:histidine kinase n=1 Tax=Limnoglobus roseus TaxID=2598579 RepID=A0A5C1AFS1_9BACT|nr:ATP-binding protein [Limnoglobus roseus]QEL16826.1 PAS domain-containing sensor histidine kinase [Limnoglobus roseus]